MDSKRRQRLDATVAAIQLRWGNNAIRTAAERSPQAMQPTLATGVAALDAALEIGGLPLGHICEFIGCGTSGCLNLALQVLRRAQGAGRHVAYVDLSRCIDLDYLARSGVRFDALLVLRPNDAPQTFAMLRGLLEQDSAGAVLLERSNELLARGPASRLAGPLRDLRAALATTQCLLLLLTEADADAASSLPWAAFAAVRLFFQQQSWLYDGMRVAGFSSAVTVLKNKFGTPGRSLRLNFRIPLERP
jgi:hypothetical protein